jgi:hypothetical protein
VKELQCKWKLGSQAGSQESWAESQGTFGCNMYCPFY